MTRTAGLALLAALSVPSLALADGFVGSVDFAMGVGTGGEVTGDFPNGSGGKSERTIENKEISSVGFGITPALDKMLGSSVGIGGEFGFWWFPNDKTDTQMVLAPHLRARMSFPIVDKVTFDGSLGVGPNIWTGNDDADARFGWGLRFGFGGSYSINQSVSAFGQFGYFTSTTYGDDVTANINTLPLSLGLRGAF